MQIQTLAAELTALEQGVARLRPLLQTHGERHGFVPTVSWEQGSGAKGPYEWIAAAKTPELKQRRVNARGACATTRTSIGSAAETT